MKHFPFCGLKYLSYTSFSNKKLKKKIAPGYYLAKNNIHLSGIFSIFRDKIFIKSLNKIKEQIINNIYLQDIILKIR